MAEYSNEAAQNKKARFSNKNTTSVGLLNSENRLRGIIRSLSMGDQFGYLSDETINLEILPFDKFSGENPEEQKKNRNIFLLAYLFNKTCQLIINQEQFIIIAAKGREELYDAIGFKKFPIQSDEYVVVMNLSSPGPLLDSIKNNIHESFSSAAAIEKFGLAPTATSNVKEEKQETESCSNKFS